MITHLITVRGKQHVGRRTGGDEGRGNGRRAVGEAEREGTTEGRVEDGGTKAKFKLLHENKFIQT